MEHSSMDEALMFIKRMRNMFYSVKYHKLWMKIFFSNVFNCSGLFPFNWPACLTPTFLRISGSKNDTRQWRGMFRCEESKRNWHLICSRCVVGFNKHFWEGLCFFSPSSWRVLEAHEQNLNQNMKYNQSRIWQIILHPYTFSTLERKQF